MKNKPSMTIQNCQLYGVKWDQPAIDAMEDIAIALGKEAEAAAKRADALCSLATVLRASNVTIESLIKIDGSGAVNMAGKKHE